MCVHELIKFGLFLLAIGRLLRQVNLDVPSIKTEQFREDHIDHVIVVIPQQLDLDETFKKTVTLWAEAFQYAQLENINFIIVPLHDLHRRKLEA